MRLTDLTPDTVAYVVSRMRAADREEIYATRWSDDPARVVADCMALASFSWVAWHDAKPCAVGGAAAVQPGVFSVYLFATDDFPKIALSVTRFARRDGMRALFKSVGARRLQCDSHINHVEAHRWLQGNGFLAEGIRRAYGKDGSDFIHYALCRADWVDKHDNTCYSDADGRTSRRSSLSPVPDTSESHVRPDALPG